MNRQLKLTRKMSGFRTQKVTSGAQIVSAVRAGTLQRSRGLVLRKERRRKDREILKRASFFVHSGRHGGPYESELCRGDFFCLSISHLPVLVRTMMALAQHLKEASTAPIATDSVGSRVRGVMRRSSSNICLWYMAASASRAI